MNAILAEAPQLLAEVDLQEVTISIRQGISNKNVSPAGKCTYIAELTILPRASFRTIASLRQANIS